ncbi:MAG: fused MFS/spermidine synthase [Acidobacteriota bacterium]|nr:fused MFS/spermidine synthase [Acidobacteriota bacterium]
MKTLSRTKGLGQDLIVTRDGETITLWSASGNRHSVLDHAAPYLPGLEYARNMLAVLAFCPQAQSCLVLGLGGGSIPRMLLAARPQMAVEAVEIDPAVVELAERYFHIRALPRFAIHLEDAADFLRRCTSRYGIVIVDTYVGEQFPDQCATPDFVRNARKCMSDDGVLAINWMSGDAPMGNDLLKNLETIIGPVWRLPGLKTHNILYFSTTKRFEFSELWSVAASLEAEIPFTNSLKRLTQRLRHPA